MDHGALLCLLSSAAVGRRGCRKCWSNRHDQVLPTCDPEDQQDVTSTHGHIGCGHRNKDAVLSVEGMGKTEGLG